MDKKTTNRKTVTITDNATGKSSDMPLLDGTIGPQVIDIRKLYNDLGHFTFDPGFTATGSCESKITYIDGDKGDLLYRGYPIEQLADKSDFLEVCYLLLYGELPTARPERQFRPRPSRTTRWCTSRSSRFFSRLPPRCASDGRACAASSARCRPSITTRPTSTIRISG